jgi:hypothetical protein
MIKTYLFKGSDYTVEVDIWDPWYMLLRDDPEWVEVEPTESFEDLVRYGEWKEKTKFQIGQTDSGGSSS